MSFKTGDRVKLTGEAWNGSAYWRGILPPDKIVTVQKSLGQNRYRLAEVDSGSFLMLFDVRDGESAHRWGGELVAESEPEQTPRAEALTKAADLIDGDREAVYGDPLVSHERIGKLWSALLGVEINAHQVAMMMAAMKLSRLAGQAEHKDSWIDLAGYAGLGYEFVVRGE